MTFQPNNIKIEVINVRTENKICTGMAKTEQGETFILNARTPANSRGICSTAYMALHSMAFAKMMIDKMEWEKEDQFDITCPHGAVTYRLSRVRNQIDG
ncbi:hypothetical protein JW960_03420 [candidate division KSB1 bacterium]|nr:hypothetical protein [candidate division KSB1 bacterium]